MQAAVGETTDRESISRGLAQVLADTRALCAKTWTFHKAVSGPVSVVLRPVLQRQCRELGVATDRIAECMRSFGPTAESQLNPSKPAHPGAVWTAEEVIGYLVKGHELLVRRTERVLRFAEKLADRATCDLLRQRMEAHEKCAWVLVAVGIAELCLSSMPAMPSGFAPDKRLVNDDHGDRGSQRQEDGRGLSVSMETHYAGRSSPRRRRRRRQSSSR